MPNDAPRSAAAKAFADALMQEIENTPRNKLGKIVVPLARDVFESFKVLEALESDYHKRSLIRALFSFIEGSTFAAKNLLIPLSSFKNIKLTDAELAIILETTATLNSKGEAKEKKLTFSIPENVKFLMKKANQLMSLTPPIDLGCTEWESILEFKIFRDRLMHPNREEDLNVSSIEVDECRKAFDWFLRAILKIIDAYDEIARKMNPLEALKAR